MPIPRSDRRFFESWLRRTGRQLSASGQLSQVAFVLAQSEGGTADEWRTRLRTILEGAEVPSLELLTRIDALLANRSNTRSGGDEQESLF